MTELGDLPGLFMDGRFVSFFMGFLLPGRFGGFTRSGFNNRAPHDMFVTIPPERADLGLCQRFHCTFHGNFHGRLDFRFFHGRDMFTRCRNLIAFSASDKGNLFYRFCNLPYLGALRGGNWFRFPWGFLFRSLGE